ncbi:DEAD/DEAH box helicase family protein [Psychromonas sp. KJ10-2]|uniref:DEAD/DEAH box helicase family protein n=1 Tax=Psychromonas sp. KJ10-2 TaxID=3391822 RepID=UPI0039B416DB
MVNTQSSNLQYGGSQLTVGNNDPLLPKLIQAINHADQIEITVSFIQRSGLALLFEPLKDALINNCQLKLLTSDYLDITDPIALRELMTLVDRGADIRIYQSDNQQSFHMKSYIFIKTDNSLLNVEIIDGCAYIGSNNISKSALTNAHEWCFRHDFKLPADSKEALTFNEIRDAFSTIFTHPKVHSLTNDWISKYLKRRRVMKFISVNEPGFSHEPIEVITPNDIQLEALKALKVTRDKGYQKGLVVLATGMGKTWLSAFDVKQMNAQQVLFVAHREEILIQAQRTFAQLLPDKKTGFYNAKNKEQSADILFASVQTIGKQIHLDKFSKTHFDYVIVDEFHHASAAIYQLLLKYFEPEFMLGLTATPERTDQADICALCDNNLVYERNLTQGIDSKILVPFHYYGIWDGSVDYSAIPWRNGRFDPELIEYQFVTHKRFLHVFEHWNKHKQKTTLAFCISTKHADFMAECFNKKGIKAASVHSQSSIRRNDALSQLAKGELAIIFSVDLFNEGTDLPAIDTILMLRPSDSKILFLQQLGRGLRLHEHKSHLVVLDFIGNHHSFLNKPAALFGSSSVKETLIKYKAPSLSEGCYINYDIEITDFWEVLSKQQRTTALEDYQSLYEQVGHPPTASEFYLQYGGLKKVNKQYGNWVQLVQEAEKQNNIQRLPEEYLNYLSAAVQTTSMTKSFKAILLKAFLHLDGFVRPPLLEDLSAESHKVLKSYPHLFETELPDKERKSEARSKVWLSYWKRNPIRAFTTVNKNGSKWFSIVDDKFVANIDISTENKQVFEQWVQELLDLRLLEYRQRETTTSIHKDADVIKIKADNLAESKREKLKFYPNLKIACGHFKTGETSEVEFRDAPDGYGHLDSNKHFLAHATGNSMNGGKQPILDGDLLLLELITPDSAGSLQGQTVVIENHEMTGDELYLLRDIKKLSDGQYQLVAKNSDYESIIADEEMKPLARLKSVIAEY